MVKNSSNIGPIWSDIGPRWSDLVQDGRIWFQMVGFALRWWDLVQDGRILSQKWSTKVKRNIFPEMSQH